METSSTVDFQSGGWSGGSARMTGDGFYQTLTAQAGYGASFVRNYLTGTGFAFFAVILLLVVLSIGIWRRLTKGV